MLRPARPILRLLALLLLVQWSLGLTHGGAAVAPSTIICTPDGLRTVQLGDAGVHDAVGHEAPPDDTDADGPSQFAQKNDDDRHQPNHRMAGGCQFCLNPAGGDLPAAPVLPSPRATAYRNPALPAPLPPLPRAPRTYSSRAPPILPQG